MDNSDNSVNVYVRLADAMAALPSGFPRTSSGVEIELLKLVFTCEEASVAAQLTRTPETAAAIAKRVGLDEAEVTVLLESMIPRRMVRADTLALESGVKGLGKVEAQGSRENTAESEKNTDSPHSWSAGLNPTCRSASRTPRGLPGCISNT